MQVLDAVAFLLVVGAAVAFGFGAVALSKANDVEAIYLLVIGMIALRAGIQAIRPGANA